MTRATGILYLFVSLSFSTASGTDSLPAQSQNPSACLSYEPSVVELTGTIVRKIFTDAQDRPETYGVLELSRPICVNQDPKGPDLNYAQKDVRLIQLAFLDQKMFVAYKDLLGEKAIAKGQTFRWDFSTSPHTYFADCQYVKNCRLTESAERTIRV
jgi:hypothetical protein